jgi:very-short-patch-repair endonuclease
VQGATYVKASINAIGGIIGRFIVEVDGWEVSSFYASDDAGTNEFILAAGLSVLDTHHVRLI